MNCDKIKIDGIGDAYCEYRRDGFAADEAEQAIRRACASADERQIAIGIERGKLAMGDVATRRPVSSTPDGCGTSAAR